MRVRIFINAATEDEVTKVYEKFIDLTKSNIKSEKVIKVEPYWKFEDMFIIETDILLNCDISSDRFDELLQKISDKWSFFGIPVNEALASATTKGCRYIMDKVEMVNIFY